MKNLKIDPAFQSHAGDSPASGGAATDRLAQTSRERALLQYRRKRRWFLPAIAVTLVLLLTFGASSNSVARRPSVVEFSDGFENAATVNALLSPTRWSAIQVEGNPLNTLTLSTSTVHGGSQALRSFAKGYNGTVQKSAITKSGIQFTDQQQLLSEAWFYFESLPDPAYAFLMDVECGGCGITGKSPGPRIMLDPGGYPAIERGKLGESTWHQTIAAVPVGQWFQLQLAIKVGWKNGGRVQLFMNGQLLIDRVGTTAPVFPRRLDRFQYGLTANGTTADSVLYTDDVTITRLN